MSLLFFVIIKSIRYLFCRYTTPYFARRDILGNQGTCSNNTARTYRYRTNYCCPMPNPDIIFYNCSTIITSLTIPNQLTWNIERMIMLTNETNTPSHKDIISDNSWS